MSTNKDRQPNRLSKETSPYLLQHAFNPVDWYAWGEEALGRAAAEDKPILLSVGYSACHWCHVMERESFENPEIAAAMNRDYICIKVDREERPDIDAIYMSAVQMLTGQGGWPMTVFLTPRGTPFYGGTYFPPEDHYGRPGFPRVLQAVADAWRTKRKELEDQGEALTGHLSRSESIIAAGGSTLLTPAILESALAAISQRYDRVYGGFGPAPKFPQPANLDLLLRLHARFHREAPLEMVETTLQRMALGGIYDQLGGGFHRYSTDAEWLAPHFEKMLYDNAQLAQTCCRAYQITGNPFYRMVAEQTLDYVLREMTDTETGAFYSAQDADSEGEEGRFFVWSRQEIVRELGGKDAALFCTVYDVSEGGNWEGKNILRVVASPAEAAGQHGLSEPEATQALESAREKLMALRDRRVRPGLDDKALTAWNGLMMSAFSLCGATFGCDRYLEAAVRNARFIADRMTTARDGLLRLYRTYRNGEAKLNAYLEDYAFYAEGLRQLYNATGNAEWIETACRVAESITALFDDPAGAGLFSTSADHEELIVRMKDWDDNAVPSGNSVALEVLLKLGAYLDRPEWKDRAAGVLRKLAETLQTHPHGFTRMLGVLDLYLDGPVEAAIRCNRGTADGREMLEALYGSYQPNLVATFGEMEETAADPPLLRSRPAEGGRATAYICRNSVCSLPITSAKQLTGAL